MTQPPNVFWTEAEVQIIRKHYPHKACATMLALLPGRGKSAIRTKARKMGLRKTEQALLACSRANCRGKDIWDDKEVALLRRLWTTAPIEQVYPAFAPRRSKRAVARKAEAMKLRRPSAEIRRALLKASAQGGAATKRSKEEKARAREQQHEQGLQLQRALLPVFRYARPNLTMVMAHPLEAAWRGVA